MGTQEHDPILSTERGLLGALLQDPKKLWDFELSTGEFRNVKHAAAYGAICELQQDGSPVDVFTVEQKAAGQYGIDVDWLLELEGKVPTAERASHYASLIRDAAIERDVRKRCHDAALSGTKGADLLTEAQRSLNELQVSARRPDAVHSSVAVEEVIRDMDARKRGEIVGGLSTGVDEFDRLLAIPPGGVLLIGGRPGMGKTSTARWVIKRIVQRGERVLMFSTESHRSAIYQQLISELTGINSRDIASGRVSDSMRHHLVAAANEIATWPIYVDDHTSDTPEIKNRIRKAKAQHEITTVVLDHIQELKHSGIRSHDPKIIMDFSLGEIRDCCREEPVAYNIWNSQLTRGPEKRPDREFRPIKSDLRASGTIEQMADNIMLLYRRSEYFPNADPTELEGIMCKSRHGPSGVVMMHWNDRLGHCTGPFARSFRVAPEQDDFYGADAY